MDPSDAFDHESLDSTDGEEGVGGFNPPSLQSRPQLQRQNQNQNQTAQWILARGRRQTRLREAAAVAATNAAAATTTTTTTTPATAPGVDASSPGRDRKIRRLETRIRELEQRALTCIVCHAADASSYFAIVPCGHVACATCLLVFLAVNPTSNIPCTLNDMRVKKCPSCRTTLTSWQRIYR
jgi:hypothetical protein